MRFSSIAVLCVLLFTAAAHAFPVPDPQAKARESRYVSQRMSANEKRAYAFEAKFRVEIAELSAKAAQYKIKMPTIPPLNGFEKMDLRKYRSGSMSVRSMEAYESNWKQKYAETSQLVEMARRAAIDAWRAANPAAAAQQDAAVNASVRTLGVGNGGHPYQDLQVQEQRQQILRQRQQIDNARFELQSEGVEVPPSLR